MSNNSKTPTFVLSLPLHYNGVQKHRLDKQFESCHKLANLLIADRKKALFEAEKTRIWRSAKEGIAELYKAQPDKEQWGKEQ